MAEQDFAQVWMVDLRWLTHPVLSTAFSFLLNSHLSFVNGYSKTCSQQLSILSQTYFFWLVTVFLPLQRKVKLCGVNSFLCQLHILALSLHLRICVSPLLRNHGPPVLKSCLWTSFYSQKVPSSQSILDCPCSSFLFLKLPHLCCLNEQRFSLSKEKQPLTSPFQSLPLPSLHPVSHSQCPPSSTPTTFGNCTNQQHLSFCQIQYPCQLTYLLISSFIFLSSTCVNYYVFLSLIICYKSPVGHWVHVDNSQVCMIVWMPPWHSSSKPTTGLPSLGKPLGLKVF